MALEKGVLSRLFAKTEIIKTCIFALLLWIFFSVFLNYIIYIHMYTGIYDEKRLR